MKLYRIEQLKDGEWQILEPQKIDDLPYIPKGMTINFVLGYMECLKFVKKVLIEKKIFTTDLDPKNFRVVDAESDSEYIDRR